MQLSILIYGLLIVLFCLCFAALHPLFSVLFNQWGKRRRLWQHQRSSRLKKFFNRFEEESGVLVRLTRMLEAVRWHMKGTLFIGLSLLLGCSGIALGAVFFVSVKGALVLGMILGCTPWIVLRMRLISLHMKTRMEFLPAVELFYQQYVMKNPKNIRLVLQELQQTNRLRYPIRLVFEQLTFNLSTRRSIDESLHLFSMSLGHAWATYFVQILSVALEEGEDMSDSLRELISDMRNSQRTDQQDRNRLLEIRVANFSPILFLVLFLSINFKLNFDQAYYYYVVSVQGKQLLLDAFLLIFLSFIMGLYLSVRRM